MIAWVALFLGASALAWHIGAATAWWRIQVRAARRKRISDYEGELLARWRPGLVGLGREARAAVYAAHADSLTDDELLAFREHGSLIYDKLPATRRDALEMRAPRRG